MESEIASLVDAMVHRHRHDGLCDESLRFVLEQAAVATLANPTAPLLEIGTFKGNTAVAILELMDALHEKGSAPLLATVDPYGHKPYHSGAVVVFDVYGDQVYCAAKQNLARFPNHAHFLMRGEEFLNLVASFHDQQEPARYWRPGLEGRFSGWAFAFLDGEHDARSVLSELGQLNMAKGGMVVVDNVDMDPALFPALVRGYRATDAGERPVGARQALIVC